MSAIHYRPDSTATMEASQSRPMNGMSATQYRPDVPAPLSPGAGQRIARPVNPSSGGHAYPFMTGIALCLSAYLYGSVPLVYLLGRWRGVDLRRVGSGNVGSTNLRAAGGPLLSLIGWVGDASKGWVPVIVARQRGASGWVAGLAGVCGVVGQCWPVFLGFRGGRGISAFVGAALAIDRSAWARALMPFIGGSLWRVLGLAFTHALTTAPTVSHKVAPSSTIAPTPTDASTPTIAPAPTVAPTVSPVSTTAPASTASRGTKRSKAVPLGCFVGVAAFPLLARHSGPAPALLSAVILLRRLTAPQPDDATAGPGVQPRSLLFRLLYDRNTGN